MSDEVWWARRKLNGRIVVSNHKALLNSVACKIIIEPEDWEDLGGPVLGFDEIIPIRPLRIERVEVEK